MWLKKGRNLKYTSLPSNIIHGCQSDTFCWSGKDEGKFAKRQPDHEHKKTKNKNDKLKGVITQSTCQKKIQEVWAPDEESLLYRQPRAIRYPRRIATISHSAILHLHPKAKHLQLTPRTLNVSGFSIFCTVGAAWGVLGSVRSMRL